MLGFFNGSWGGGGGANLARGGGASEGDLGHQRVAAQNLPDRRRLRSGARNHVEDPCWDPGLLRQLQGERTLETGTTRTKRIRKQTGPTSARASADRGVSSAGFTTTVQPAARAAPTFLVIMALGKFHCGTTRPAPSRYYRTQSNQIQEQKPATHRRDDGRDPHRLLQEQDPAVPGRCRDDVSVDSPSLL